jgi:hypothetical protein
MTNSVAILSHLKAHRSKEPTYERTARGINDAFGSSKKSSSKLVSSTLCRLKQAGLIAPNPSKMIVGKRPNGKLRGMGMGAAYDITEKGIEYLEVRLHART